MSVENPRAVPAGTWPELLREARTPKEILGHVRDFIATWTPEEIAQLPRGCDPPLRFQEPEDVVFYAFALSQVRLKGGENASLQRMWSFFMEATRRVAAVTNRRATNPART